MIPIVIPTKGRVDRQSTLRFIPGDIREHTYLFSPGSEAVDLEILHADVNVIQVPLAINTASLARQYIVDWGLRNKHKQVIMMDDDLLLYTVGEPRDPAAKTPFSLYGMSLKSFNDMYDELCNQLKRFPVTSILQRTGCNYVKGVGEERARVSRVSNVLGLDLYVMTDVGFKFTDMARGVMEDYHLLLSMYSRGYDVWVSGRYAQNQASNSSGGCSDYRNGAVQKAGAEELAARWSQFVTVVQKKCKNNTWWGNRTDVRISWAKAKRFTRNA